MGKTNLFGSYEEPEWRALREAFSVYKNNQYDEAMSQFIILTEQGSLMAPVYIGQMYEEGYGVAQDYNIAMNWYHKSAERGLPTAQFYLAQLQRKCGHYTEAVAWHRRAAEQGLIPSLFAFYWLYSRGEIQVDQTLADQYLLKASKAGHVHAQKHHACRMI
jgi:uncharacterized protein